MSVWEIGRFKLFLPRRINTVLEFSCTRNSMFVCTLCDDDDDDDDDDDELFMWYG